MQFAVAKGLTRDIVILVVVTLGGGLVTWILRYALFVAGVVFGLAWPRLFGA